VKAFDEIVDGAFKVFIEKCCTIAGDVKPMSDMLIKAFK